MVVYLDNAATTPIRPEVIAVMTEAMQKNYGNPSSVHSVGRDANFEVLTARTQIAKSINANEDEIIFTSSGSEGDNLALLKTAELLKQQGNHIISSAIEHPAVLNTLKYLETQGYEVTYLPVDEHGRITLEQVQADFTDKTILVSLMYGNNEIGTIFPLQEIAEWLQTTKALFHTDAVQAYGIEDINVQKLPVDLLTVAAHKVNGPKGIGFLYVRQGTKLLPLIHGGEQERHLRAGTENLPAILGFAEAVKFLTPTYKAEQRAKYLSFRKLIVESLTKSGIAFKVNGVSDTDEPHLAHILSLWFPNINSQILLTRLDLLGYAVSVGSACTAGNIEKSHVLTAVYGKDSSAVDETVRISFGYQITKNEVEEFIADLKRIIIELND